MSQLFLYIQSHNLLYAQCHNFLYIRCHSFLNILNVTTFYILNVIISYMYIQCHNFLFLDWLKQCITHHNHQRSPWVSNWLSLIWISFPSLLFVYDFMNTWSSNDSIRLETEVHTPRRRKRDRKEDEEDASASGPTTFDRRNTHAVWGRVHKCHRVEARVDLILGLATPVKYHPHQVASSLRALAFTRHDSYPLE